MFVWVGGGKLLYLLLNGPVYMNRFDNFLQLQDQIMQKYGSVLVWLISGQKRQLDTVFEQNPVGTVF